MHLSHLQISTSICLFMAMYTLILSSVRTHSFVVKEGGIVFGFGAILWGIQLLNGILWSRIDPFLYVFCVLLWQFATSVFLFGIAVLVSQDPEVTSTILIRKDSILHRFLDWAPFEVRNSSLCSMSWMTTFYLFVIPMFIIVATVFLGVVALLASSLTLKNPLIYVRAFIPHGDMNSIEGIARFKNGFPMSPVVYLLPLTICYMLFKGTYHQGIPNVMVIVIETICVASFIGFYGITHIFNLPEKKRDYILETESATKVAVLVETIKDRVCPLVEQD